MGLLNCKSVRFVCVDQESICRVEVEAEEARTIKGVCRGEKLRIQHQEGMTSDDTKLKNNNGKNKAIGISRPGSSLNAQIQKSNAAAPAPTLAIIVVIIKPSTEALVPNLGAAALFPLLLPPP